MNDDIPPVQPDEVDALIRTNLRQRAAMVELQGAIRMRIAEVEEGALPGERAEILAGLRDALLKSHRYLADIDTYVAKGASLKQMFHTLYGPDGPPSSDGEGINGNAPACSHHARADKETPVTDHMDPNEAHVMNLSTNVFSAAPKHDTPTARYTTADEFLSLAGKITTEEVYVPTIDRTLIVKAPTAADVQRARQDIVETRAGRTVPRLDRDFAVMIAFYCTVNPDGSQFFRRDQIDMLNKDINYAAIQPLSTVALRLGGLDAEAEELARKKHEEGSKSGG